MISTSCSSSSCCCTRARAAACPTCSAAASPPPSAAVQRCERNLDRITIGLGLVWSARSSGSAWPSRPDVRPYASTLENRKAPPVAGGNAIRGSRVGAGPMGEAERGDAAPRHRVSFYCAHGHETHSELRRRGRRPGDLGLPALRLPGRAATRRTRRRRAEDRALQDPPGLREGAALRRRRRRHPQRGHRQAPRQVVPPSSDEGPSPCAGRRAFCRAWSGGGAAVPAAGIKPDRPEDGAAAPPPRPSSAAWRPSGPAGGCLLRGWRCGGSRGAARRQRPRR